MTRKTVLVLVYPENPFVTRQWLRGLSRYAKTAKWIVEMAPYAGGLAQRKKILSLVRYLHPDGIVSSCHENLSDGTLKPFPHVWFDVAPGRIPRGDSLVFHAGDETGALAAKELLRLGLRHFAAVGDQPYRIWSGKRLKSFASQVRGRGNTLDQMELACPVADKVACLRAIEPWLGSLPRPCGVFAANDQIAAHVVSAANRLRLRIPEDLAVVGVDNDEYVCTIMTPTLTSISTDWEKGGFLVGETLDQLMRNPQAKPIRVSFGELGVIRRTSTSLGGARVDPRVADASVFIREHACEGIGVEDVVRRMGCSRRLAMMRYLEATGRSIFAEIRETQFEQVLNLLSQRDVQIGALADRCGWKSPTALRTYFEKRLGMTMREWRARNPAK